MKDSYAAGRRNLLIAFIIVAVGIAGFVFIVQPWMAKRAADEQGAQARAAAYKATVQCVEANGSLKDFLAEDTRLIFAGSTCTINALSSANAAAYQAAAARCDYETKLARITHATGLCQRWAACDKTHSEKEAFESCYGVFGPHEADDGYDGDDGADR